MKKDANEKRWIIYLPQLQWPGKIYFSETFGDGWESRWTGSEALGWIWELKWIEMDWNGLKLIEMDWNAQLPQKSKELGFRRFHHRCTTPGLMCRTSSEWKKSDGTQAQKICWWLRQKSSAAIAIQIGQFWHILTGSQIMLVDVKLFDSWFCSQQLLGPKFWSAHSCAPCRAPGKLQPASGTATWQLLQLTSWISWVLTEDSRCSRHLKTDWRLAQNWINMFDHLQLTLQLRAKYCWGDEKEDQGIQTAEERCALECSGSVWAKAAKIC